MTAPGTDRPNSDRPLDQPRDQHLELDLGVDGAIAQLFKTRIQPTLLSRRRMTAEHPIEKVGAKLREMMPWIAAR